MGTKARRPHRKHAATLEIKQPLPLAKSKHSLWIVVRVRNRKVGELAVGRGSVTWWGRKAKKGKRIGWSRFVALMDEQ